MPIHQIGMKPGKSGGKITSLRVGPVWTVLTVKLPTKSLQRQTSKVTKKTKLHAAKAGERR